MDRTETIFEDFDTEAPETQAEVLDQTISLLRSMKECCNPRHEGQGKSRFHRWVRGTQREYISNPLKHSIVKRFLVFNGKYGHIFIP